MLIFSREGAFQTSRGGLICIYLLRLFLKSKVKVIPMHPRPAEIKDRSGPAAMDPDVRELGDYFSTT